MRMKEKERKKKKEGSEREKSFLLEALTFLVSIDAFPYNEEGKSLE